MKYGRGFLSPDSCLHNGQYDCSRTALRQSMPGVWEHLFVKVTVFVDFYETHLVQFRIQVYLRSAACADAAVHSDPCAVSIAFVTLKLRAQCSFRTAGRTFDFGCPHRHIIFDAEIKAAAGDLLYFFFVQFI